MPEILFVQLYFAIMIPYLFDTKKYYFSTGPLLYAVHRTGSAQQVRCLFSISFYHHLKACSSVVYLQHVAQSAQGIECHVSLSPLLSQSSLQYIALNFFGLVFPTTPIILISSHFCPLISFRLKGNSTRPKTGDKFLPQRGRSRRAATISRATGEANPSPSGWGRKRRNIFHFLDTTPSFWQKQLWLLFGVALAYVCRAPEATYSPLVLPESLQTPPKQAAVLHVHNSTTGDSWETLLFPTQASCDSGIGRGFEPETPSLGTRSLRLGLSDYFIQYRRLWKSGHLFSVPAGILNFSNNNLTRLKRNKASWRFSNFSIL